MSGRRKAAVIGAGFGGLALAIRLQCAGIETTLFERRDRVGGRAYVYHDSGFTFDAGPTVVTDPTALTALFTLAGRRIEDYVALLPVDPFYRLLWEDGRRFDYVNDQVELDRQIAAFEPRDVAGYRRFLDYSQAVFAEGYLKLGHVPFLDFASMLKAAPNLVRLQGYRSVHAVVARFVRNPQLRQAFSFHSLLVGGNPFATSAIYALIHALERKWGIFYARGGTGALVDALARLFVDIGGTVRTGADVVAIETRDARVTGVATRDGRHGSFDLVASNADIVHTYARLLADTPAAQSTARKLVRKRFSMSLFVVYFGLRGSYPGIAHHSVLFGPRYRELIDEIFTRDRLATDFSLYVHAPSVTDPSVAPPGCSTFYALSPVPHLGTAPIDWSVEGPRYRDRILDHIEARMLPGLRRNLLTTRILTPFDFRDELNSHLGSAFSLEPVLTQSAYFRGHNRDANVRGLYLVGAGTHPGAGIPGVLASARATAGLMLEAPG